MKPTYIVSALLVLIAIVMGVLFVTNMNDSSDETTTRQDTTNDAAMDMDEVANQTNEDAESEFSNLEGAVFGTEVDAQNQAEVTINIDDFLYEQTVVTVSKGTTVTWVNDGQVRHDVVTADGSEIDGINSELLANGETFSHTFDTAGQFDYFCSPHPSQMRGVVVVK